MIRKCHLAMIVLAATAALTVAACAGSPSGGVNTSQGLVGTMTPGQGYLQIMGPANQAAHRFNKTASTYTDTTTASVVARDAAPLAEAIRTARNDLLSANVNWRDRYSSPRPPAHTQQDVKELLKALGGLYGDLVPVGAAKTSFSTANWTKQLAHDGARVRAAATIVRADLRLPPARASSF